ncbi:unnamed protein product [Clonostachys rosea f. rosea IK726]|uniref:Uncharacterized protein n=1 Tax=Clonostachys rosea f. rosea IK726 TaxID=1349383 RepID=A0ACA9TG95_BIOOC|nr:unnamed protein product [Clonostachys rosea f. rosea IK726]
MPANKATWTRIVSSASLDRSSQAASIVGNKLYIFGGELQPRQPVDNKIHVIDLAKDSGGSLDLFDLEAQTWSTTQYKADQVEGPEARSVATLLSAKVQGKSYLVTMFGERDPSPLGHAGAGKMLKDVWVYDIEQGKWNIVETEGDAPVARGWFDADVTTGAGDQDDIVVHGGLSDGNTRLGDVWRLSFI